MDIDLTEGTHSKSYEIIVELVYNSFNNMYERIMRKKKKTAGC